MSDRDNVNIRDVLLVRSTYIETIRLIGFQGKRLEDQNELFPMLESRMHEIPEKLSDKPCLTILPAGLAPFVGVEVTQNDDVPEGMACCTIPADEYMVFRFETKHIGTFWECICSEENQTYYGIDLAKPRFEMFTSELEAEGVVEWYIPRREDRKSA